MAGRTQPRRPDSLGEVLIEGIMMGGKEIPLREQKGWGSGKLPVDSVASTNEALLERSNMLSLTHHMVGKMTRFCLALFCILGLTRAGPVPASSVQDRAPEAPKVDYTRPVEHQELEDYAGPFTCAECHEDVLEEVMRSAHYTWKPKLANGGKYSKLQMTAPTINWLGILNEEKHTAGGCGLCHIGGGPIPVNADKAPETDKGRIDCLICHAAEYDMKVRYPEKVGDGWILPQDRRLEAARSVGRTTRDACLRCHYISLWGYKRGAEIKGDVHFKKKMSCTRCHRAESHRFPGYGPTITKEVSRRVRCTDCHDLTPHRSDVLNRHVRLDCRTCHIVSASGVFYKDGTREGVIDERRGIFKMVEKTGTQRPVYFWYDGLSRGPLPRGSRNDPSSKIQPFKKFTGVAPVDAQTGEFLWLKLRVFAETGDVTRSIEAGATASCRPYSGSWVAKEYDVYFQLSHGVTKTDALRCKDCHSLNGTMDFEVLGYSEDEIQKLKRAH